MKLIRSMFESRKVKKLFDAEGYTKKELSIFFRDSHQIDSRLYENFYYLVTEGQIKLIEKR